MSKRFVSIIVLFVLLFVMVRAVKAAENSVSSTFEESQLLVSWDCQNGATVYEASYWTSGKIWYEHNGEHKQADLIRSGDNLLTANWDLPIGTHFLRLYQVAVYDASNTAVRVVSGSDLITCEVDVTLPNPPTVTPTPNPVVTPTPGSPVYLPSKPELLHSVFIPSVYGE